MGQIIVMKDKIEIQVIDTPDYSAQIETINREFEKQTKMDNLAKQAMQVSCDDILEQMIAYVTMTMSSMFPILQHSQRLDARYGCFAVQNLKDCFSFTISTCNNRIVLHIFENTIEYLVDNRKSFSPYQLSSIILDWAGFKEELNRVCEYVMRNITVSLRCKQEDNEKYINNIANFKL